MNWWLLLLFAVLVAAVALQNLWLRRRAEGRPLLGGRGRAPERKDDGEGRA